MTAGASAHDAADTARRRAGALERQAVQQRALAARMDVAGVTEMRTAKALAVLAPMGHVLLTDRRWPGSDPANVDLLLVGPGGVIIVDTKAWADVSIARGRMFRGQADVTDELVGLRRLADLARAELAEIGLPPTEVLAVVVLAGHRNVHEALSGVTVVGGRDVVQLVARRGQRLNDSQVDRVLQRCLAVFPALAGRTVAADPLPCSPAVDRLDDEQLEIISSADVQNALLAGALVDPVEDWMTFLHPDQAKHVQRSTNGPARVRGAAGTGKTVVGLHRTAHLTSRRPGRVLYTTHVRTLPYVWQQTYARLSPETVDRVDFTSIHRFALELLRARGLRTNVDLHGAKTAYAAAWSQVGKPGMLRQVPQGWTYWREEINSVIKGRGIRSFATYADLHRVGRRYPLSRHQRGAVWQLYLAYETELRRRGIHDLDDVLVAAEQEVRRQPMDPGYAMVVVDEVQDLTCVGVRLLHALVGDRPDGLLLIGDGQQAVYPGGFTLAEAGVDVRGRSTVLRHNYRNTAEILGAARAVVSSDAFSDLDDLDELGDRAVDVSRHGPPPVRVDAPDLTSHDAALIVAIEDARAGVGVGLGDIAVLVATKSLAKQYASLLDRHGIATVDLERYDGRTTGAVKIGTFHRAKGLEFKHVLLPQLTDGPSTRWEAESADAFRERVELARRCLFVAMTRVRDGLWLGYVTEPAEEGRDDPLPLRRPAPTVASDDSRTARYRNAPVSLAGRRPPWRPGTTEGSTSPAC